MSRTCIFFSADGQVSVKESLSSRNMFTFLQKSMEKPKLIYAYMDWMIFGSAHDAIEDTRSEKNKAATMALAKICKEANGRALQGSIAFCFRSPTCKAIKLIKNE